MSARLRLASAALILLFAPQGPRARAALELSNGAYPLSELAGFALSTDALGSDAALPAALADPTVRQYLKYIVTCALRADQSFTVDVGGQPVTFTGDGGIAPGWADGPCDLTCQEAVSACLYARINAYGVPVRILMSGPASLVPGTTPEQLAMYPVQEGAFFGNFWAQTSFSCRGRGFDPLGSTLRVCSQTNCGSIVFLGNCEDYCDSDTSTGSEIFYPCHAVHRSAGGSFPAGDHAYLSLTTYLRASQLGSCP